MLFSYVALQVTTSQLTNYVFVAEDIHFQAPCLFTFVKLSIRILLFPLYLGLSALINLIRRRPAGLRITISHCKLVFGPNGLSARNLIIRIVPSAITMLGHQLAYTYCMAYLTTSIGTAMIALAATISYILSWLILKNSLLFVKCFFVLVSLAGISLIAHASFTSNYKGNASLGIIAAIVSVLSLCIHQILFKQAFPIADLRQISFVLELVFIFISVVFLPVPIILKLTGVEVYDIQLMPYTILISTWILSAFNSTAYGYGLILSGPHFMSIGELLNLALNSGIDVYIRHLPMQANQVAGTVLVAVAFIVLILPNHLLSLNIRQRLYHLTNFRYRRATIASRILVHHDSSINLGLHPDRTDVISHQMSSLPTGRLDNSISWQETIVRAGERSQDEMAQKNRRTARRSTTWY